MRQEENLGLQGGPSLLRVLGEGEHTTTQAKHVWASMRWHICVRKAILNSRQETNSNTVVFAPLFSISSSILY